MNYNTFLPPFKWFVLQNFPYIEDDFDALTNWQLFCKLGKEMNKIIEKCNLTGEQVENLTNAYNELKAYVDNYFENLDVQEEVNIKLDEMAESGELADLIAQYLESQAIIGFNTCSALASATNLANGSFARTLGRNTYNDGYGAFYKIRTRINTDDPDGYNLIVLTETENLVAEKMNDSHIANLENSVSNLQDAITDLSSNRTILIGDSYAMYRPTLSINGWQVYLQQILGLSDDNCYKLSNSGGGFKREGDNGTFLQHLTNQASNITDHDTIKNIIVCGGLNDRIYTVAELETSIETFINYCKTTYPNATVYVGMVGNSKGLTEEKQVERMRCLLYSLPAYQNCTKYGARYLNGVEYIMKDYSNYYDDSHPNDTASLNLAKGIFNAFTTGYCSVSYTRENKLPISSSIVDGNSLPFSYNFFDNTFSFEGLAEYSLSIDFVANQSTNGQIDLGTVDFKYYRNVYPWYFAKSVEGVLILADNTSVPVSAQIYVNQGHFYFRFTNTSGNTYSVKSLRLRPFSITIPGCYC